MASIFDNAHNSNNDQRYISPTADLITQGLNPESSNIGETCLIVFSFHVYNKLLKILDIDKSFVWPYNTTLVNRCTAPNGSYFSIHFPSYGSPRIASSLELLASMGIKNLYGLGLAGTLQENVQIGDIVIVEGSVRGDGVSRYYVPDEYPSFADMELTFKIISELKKRPNTAPCWTLIWY